MSAPSILTSSDGGRFTEGTSTTVSSPSTIANASLVQTGLVSSTSSTTLNDSTASTTSTTFTTPPAPPATVLSSTPTVPATTTSVISGNGAGTSLSQTLVSSTFVSAFYSSTRVTLSPSNPSSRAITSSSSISASPSTTTREAAPSPTSSLQDAASVATGHRKVGTIIGATAGIAFLLVLACILWMIFRRWKRRRSSAASQSYRSRPDAPRQPPVSGYSAVFPGPKVPRAPGGFHFREPSQTMVGSPVHPRIQGQSYSFRGPASYPDADPQPSLKGRLGTLLGRLAPFSRPSDEEDQKSWRQLPSAISLGRPSPRRSAGSLPSVTDPFINQPRSPGGRSQPGTLRRTTMSSETLASGPGVLLRDPFRDSTPSPSVNSPIELPAQPKSPQHSSQHSMDRPQTRGNRSSNGSIIVLPGRSRLGSNASAFTYDVAALETSRARRERETFYNLAGRKTRSQPFDLDKVTSR